ncbi:hypothetical protein GYMLUDRAFT_246590 [Collybiopsis luxurians FD-317 M1]|uniref:Uncharacterized protein n=1 Tax=Collybiopsis luxurians FD-317 M1 TaxID=944289 RepID=A0A0D0B3U2_9AGAR|nr:hypothetical protein GYMLUDRAFT_246590 [Collybiopsis luxurians FD-317 M1]
MQVEEELYDLRRAHAHGQEDDMRMALDGVCCVHGSRIELDVTRSNLQMISANNEVLEGALKNLSSQVSFMVSFMEPLQSGFDHHGTNPRDQSTQTPHLPHLLPTLILFPSASKSTASIVPESASILGRHRTVSSSSVSLVSTISNNRPSPLRRTRLFTILHFRVNSLRQEFQTDKASREKEEAVQYRTSDSKLIVRALQLPPAFCRTSGPSRHGSNFLRGNWGEEAESTAKPIDIVM